MKVFNYGSINIDHIYRVGDFVRPGETLASDNYRMMLGGKGANQSIALVKAGVQVQHLSVSCLQSRLCNLHYAVPVLGSTKRAVQPPEAP